MFDLSVKGVQKFVDDFECVAEVTEGWCERVLLLLLLLLADVRISSNRALPDLSQSTGCFLPHIYRSQHLLQVPVEGN